MTSFWWNSLPPKSCIEYLSAEIHLNVDSSETCVATKAAQRNTEGRREVYGFQGNPSFCFNRTGRSLGGCFDPLMRLISAPLFSESILCPLQLPQSRVPLNKRDIQSNLLPPGAGPGAMGTLCLRRWNYWLVPNQLEENHHNRYG